MTDARAMPEPALSFRLCVGWGLGGFGTVVLGNAFGALLLRYMTDFLGIAASTAALLFAVSKVYDAVADPAIGAISDRTRTRIGRRRPYLIAGTILAPIALLAMFIVPDFTRHGFLIAWMAGVLVLYSTSYAIWEVPYLAMPAEMTGDPTERTRLAAYRSYAAAIGQLLFVILGPWALAWWGADRRAYGWMALALALLVLATNAITYRTTASARFVRQPEPAPFSFGEAYLAPLRSRPFLILVGAKGALFFGLAAQGATFAFFIKYTLAISDMWIGNFLLVLTFASLVSVPFWMTLRNRFEKKTVALMGGGMFVLGSLSWLTVQPHEPGVLLIARGAVKGFGLTGVLIYTYSMFTDVIEYDHAVTGIRREGAFAGLFATSEKIFSALGLIYALAPAGFGAVAMGLIACYPLSAARLRAAST